jgi:hypothetical protein
MTTITTTQLRATLDAANLALTNSQIQNNLLQVAAVNAQKTYDTAMAAGLTAGTVGDYSIIDQLLQTERSAGKNASIDYVKLNPACTETDATTAWSTAALAATQLSFLIVPVENYALLYRTNLFNMGLVTDTTWESERAWIVGTAKDLIMST